MTVHVEDPRRWVALFLAVVVVAAVVLILWAISGSSEPVPVGRS